ncbi:MAG: RnfABCDGE type electron transport complex subunit D [Chloroflexi bacterium]|nr:RnfABCDGE type electron transport complex subunit D [Chloroflexota bacterium]
MSAVTFTAEAPALRSVRRFFRTPKGILLLIFTFTMLLAAAKGGPALVLPGVLVAMSAAAAVDVAVARLARQAWVFPSGGLLSGLIVALVLSPHEPLVVPAATAVLAIASKHLFRTRFANVFNPASLALVLAAVLFKSNQSWWGALPDLGWPGAAVLLVTGAFIADRINKLPLVLTFLGLYFTLFTAASFTGNAAGVREVFIAPDLQAVLFFAFFMLDDPPTCPVQYRDQAIFGAIVAVTSFMVFQLFGWLYFLPAGLLVGNAYEGLRRRSRQTRRRAPAPTRA